MRIRRTATIPVKHNDDDILALIEVGGKVENKNWIYEQFFINGFKGTKEEILRKIKEKGGTAKNFEKMMNDARGKIEAELTE